MYLNPIIDLMYEEGTAAESLPIRVISAISKGTAAHCVYYDGPLKKFHDYIRDHKHIEYDPENGFYHKAINIRKFMVVEIKIDESKKDYNKDLPDYNKAKLITII